MNVGDGFSANPQDVVAGPGRQGLRHPLRPQPRAAPTRAATCWSSTGRGPPRLGRIALPAPATSRRCPAARRSAPGPARAVLVGDRLYVALNNLSDDFEAAAPGRVAVIDTTSDRVVASIDLPGLKNCGALTRAPGRAGRDALVVGCTGVYSDGPRQIDTAGFAWVDLDAEPAGGRGSSPRRTFERTVSGSIARGGQRRPRLHRAGRRPRRRPPRRGLGLRLPGRPAPQAAATAAGPSSCRWPSTARPGASTCSTPRRPQPRVHVFDLPPDGTTTPAGSFVASPATGLPPRHLGFY